LTFIKYRLRPYEEVLSLLKKATKKLIFPKSLKEESLFWFKTLKKSGVMLTLLKPQKEVSEGATKT
jgi:hypothetical protein